MRARRRRRRHGQELGDGVGGTSAGGTSALLEQLFFHRANRATNDVDERRAVGVELERGEDLAEATAELDGREVFAGGADAKRAANDAIEDRRQRRPRGTTAQQRHQIVQQGADASEVETGLGNPAGQQSARRAQPRQPDLALGTDAHMTEGDVAVGEPRSGDAGAGSDAVQGRDGRAEVTDDQQTLVAGEIDATILQRRRQLDKIETLKPWRDREADAVDDAMAKMWCKIRVALADQAIATALQLGEMAGLEAPMDLEEKRTTQGHVIRLVAVGRSRATEVFEQSEVAKPRHWLRPIAGASTVRHWRLALVWFCAFAARAAAARAEAM